MILNFKSIDFIKKHFIAFHSLTNNAQLIFFKCFFNKNPRLINDFIHKKFMKIFLVDIDNDASSLLEIVEKILKRSRFLFLNGMEVINREHKFCLITHTRYTIYQESRSNCVMIFSSAPCDFDPIE